MVIFLCMVHLQNKIKLAVFYKHYLEGYQYSTLPRVGQHAGDKTFQCATRLHVVIIIVYVVT